MIQIFVATRGSSNASDGFLSILMPLFGLVAFIVVAWILITAVRRQLKSNPPAPSITFSLQELRTMRSQGLISDEEYERARDIASAPTRPLKDDELQH